MDLLITVVATVAVAIVLLALAGVFIWVSTRPRREDTTTATGRRTGSATSIRVLRAVEANDEIREEPVMLQTGTFATAINCIDGRAQRPVADWVRINAQATFVDTPTVAGPDKVLTEGPPERIALVREQVEISLRAHGSRCVAIAGHHGCAGNPVSDEQHREMIRAAVEVMRGWDLRDDDGRPVRLVGLWVNDWWQAEVVVDTGA